MKDNIKLISLDLDGTLLRSDGTLSAFTVATLKKCKDKGFTLVFNTARPRKIIPGFLLNEFNADIWIFSNGSTCFHNEKELFNYTFPAYEVLNIIDLIASKYNDLFYSVESGGEIYSSFNCEITCEKYFAEVIQSESLKNLFINKLLIISENRNFPIDQITIDSNKKILITEHGKYVQVMDKSISKLFAIQCICKELNLNIQNVLSFGDDLNDLELLEASAIGVAVDNSFDNIKSKADFITKSNNEDGVAIFLEKYL